MIQVLCDPGCGFMGMIGHADAAPKGQDTVCSAASMLAYTLAAVVRDYERAGLVRRVVIDTEPGRALVCCRAVPGQELPVYAVFEMIHTGARLLAERYPEYVRCVEPEDLQNEDWFEVWKCGGAVKQ